MKYLYASPISHVFFTLKKDKFEKTNLKRKEYELRF